MTDEHTVPPRIPPEIRVLAAIGAWALKDANGRPEFARAIFDSVIPLFDSKFPHHKMLSDFCFYREYSQESRDVTPRREHHAELLADIRKLEAAAQVMKFDPEGHTGIYDAVFELVGKIDWKAVAEAVEERGT